MKKYTVKTTKKDGMKSIYFVLAVSAGGAETAVLNDVFNSEYALATEGWPEGVRTPDLCSDAVNQIFINRGIEEEMKVTA